MKKILEIDLSGHTDPGAFVKTMSEKYPDSEVELSLKGHRMEVKVSSAVPLQTQIDISSFLNARVKECLHSCA